MIGYFQMKKLAVGDFESNRGNVKHVTLDTLTGYHVVVLLLINTAIAPRFFVVTCSWNLTLYSKDNITSFGVT